MESLNCKSLMIGDWVLKDMNYSEEDPLYTKLDYRPYQIMSGEDIDLACETNCIGDADVYQPIPLTPEILEKNGFKLRDGFFYHRIDDKPHHYDFKLENGGVFTSEGYTLQCCIYHLTIRYVHELQHCLHLCGLNELADNLKLEE